MIGLSKHIEILLLSNDCVIVPGFGGFMAHHVDARKDLDDGSFLPPIRSIGFNPKLTLNDSLLAQSYVEVYDISYPDAVKRLEDEVRELTQRIETDGFFDFKGIGKVSLNNEGNFEFSPCEAGLLTPTLYGLGSFQMKTIAELNNSQAYPYKPVAREHKTDEGGNTSISESYINEHKRAARLVSMWRNVAVACIAALLFLLIPSPLVNNAQMAGTAIDTSLLVRVMPKDITTGHAQVSKAVVATKATVQDTVAIAKKHRTSTPIDAALPRTGFSIVLASHVTLNNANAYVQSLQQRGYKDAYVYHKNHVKVMYGKFANRAAASKAMNSLNNKDEFAGAWITEVKY